jgi:hypothetical protein
MISKDKIEKNKNKFQEVNETYGIFTRELEEFLGEEFYTCPASPSLDLYGAYPGGLLDHLLKVCKYTLLINDLIPEKIRIEKNKIIKTVFLSQIGKVFLFVLNDSEWHRTNLGKMYKYQTEGMAAMKVGERSAYYALKHGCKLDEDEYQAIINHDKDSDDKMAKWYSGILTQIMKQGFELALIEEKYGKQ